MTRADDYRRGAADMVASLRAAVELTRRVLPAVPCSWEDVDQLLDRAALVGDFLLGPDQLGVELVDQLHARQPAVRVDVDLVAAADPDRYATDEQLADELRRRIGQAVAGRQL